MIMLDVIRTASEGYAVVIASLNMLRIPLQT
jgi:hypothetical protein